MKPKDKFKILEFGETNPAYALLPSEAVDTTLVFGIQIGGLGILIPVNQYCEVLENTQVYAFPNTSPWLSGMINLRGNLLPVFDLHLLLGEAIHKKKRRLFSIGSGENALALWIDGFPKIKDSTNLHCLSQEPNLPVGLQSFVNASYEQDAQIWLELRLAEFFKVLGRPQPLSAER